MAKPMDTTATSVGTVTSVVNNAVHGVAPATTLARAAPAPAVLALCFTAILLDGLDTSSIGVAGPAIAAHFGVPPSSLTAPFVMTSIGAVIGYLLSGSLVERWTARRILLACVVAFGVLSLATPLAGSIAQLALLRLITAIGLGAALPSAISIAVEQVSPRLRAAVTIIVGTGLASGGVLGGVLGGMITQRYGWEYLFYVGGALPLTLFLCLWRWLPTGATTRQASSAGDNHQSERSFVLIARLLAKPGQTIGLWVFSFLIFADAYALLFWLPSLLIGFGFSPENAQFGVGAFSAGGLFANIVLALLVSRFAVARAMLTASLIAAMCAAGIALDASTLPSMWLLIAGAGAGLIACSVGQSALAVSIYPQALRTNGVGFSAAAGRIGSIVGPAIAGLLFSLGWTPRSIVIAAIAPILAAVLALLLLISAMRRDAVNRDSSGTQAN